MVWLTTSLCWQNLTFWLLIGTPFPTKVPSPNFWTYWRLAKNYIFRVLKVGICLSDDKRISLLKFFDVFLNFWYFLTKTSFFSLLIGNYCYTATATQKFTQYNSVLLILLHYYYRTVFLLVFTVKRSMETGT